MARTAAQIVNLACQKARGPGYLTQAGQLLNVILSDLCQDYDLDVAKGTFNFTFNTSLTTTAVYPNLTLGGGPYPLPADFLRMVDEKDAMWFLQGVPYPMIPCDLSEFDGLVQQAGNQSYPYIFATDVSQSPPNLVVYPPPSANYPAMLRYRRQMPDIVAPESDAVTIPWFPNQSYLIQRLTAEVMDLTDDSRAQGMRTEADGMLGRYLKMKDDSTNRAQTVKLDRRRFGRRFDSLSNTKSIGW